MTTESDPQDRVDELELDRMTALQGDIVEVEAGEITPVKSGTPAKPEYLEAAEIEPEPQRRWWDRKLIKIGLPIVLVLIGGRAIRLSMVDRSTQYLTQTVERQSIPVNISANGIVNAERSINLSPKSAGIIKNLLVKEGDRVTQGQTIAIMDDANLRGQFIQMQGQLAQQMANLKRLQAGNRPQDIAKAAAQVAEYRANLQQLKSGNRPQEIAQAQAKVAQLQAVLAQLQSDRTEEIAQAKYQLESAASKTQLTAQRYQSQQLLRKEGAISQDKLNEVENEYRQARSQEQQAQRRLIQVQRAQPLEITKQQAAIAEAQQGLKLQQAGARTEQIAQAEAKLAQQEQALSLLKAGTRTEDIEQAQAQVRSAQGSLENIQAQMNDTKVVAPFNGFVAKKYADIGAFVSPAMGGGNNASASSSSILTLSSARSEIIVNISESQIGKIKPGQTVNLKVDAFPGEKFAGKVDRIAPKASIAQNVTSFEVYVALTYPSAEKLKAGMNAEAQFGIGNLDNALLVPNAAVVRQPQGEGVYILNGDRQPEFKAIQTGVSANGKTEVKSGLAGNEQVLISPPPVTPANSGGFKFQPPKPPEGA